MLPTIVHTGYSACLSLIAGLSHAQSGTPDLTFGIKGRVLTTFGNANDEAFVAASRMARSVAAGFTNAPVANNDDGNFAVVRYNLDAASTTRSVSRRGYRVPQ